MNWAYGITTVPSRCHDLLPATVEALARVGFNEPVIFMDGECDGIFKLPLKVVCHNPNVGHLLNWMNAAFYLYQSFPKAGRYVIFEDDLDTCADLRQYLEATEIPDGVYLNLLTHPQNYAVAGPTEGWSHSNQRGLGAVALVFNPKGLQDLLMSPIFVNRTRLGRKAADGLVIDALKPQGYKEWTHNPTLVQHVGIESTLGHNYGPMKGFKGSSWSPLELLP